MGAVCGDGTDQLWEMTAAEGVHDVAVVTASYWVIAPLSFGAECRRELLERWEN